MLNASKDNPAREALTLKCVKVIVEHFERLPAHDATSGLYVCSNNGGDSNGDGSQDATRDGVIEGADASVATKRDAVGGGSGIVGVGGGGGEAKLDEDENVETAQQKERQREGRVIPAKFLQLISAGLSTDLDPKVWIDVVG